MGIDNQVQRTEQDVGEADGQIWKRKKHAIGKKGISFKPEEAQKNKDQNDRKCSSNGMHELDTRVSEGKESDKRQKRANVVRERSQEIATCQQKYELAPKHGPQKLIQKNRDEREGEKLQRGTTHVITQLRPAVWIGSDRDPALRK